MREYVKDVLGYVQRIDTVSGSILCWIRSLQLALAQLGEARGVEEELAALRHLLQDELKRTDR